MSKTKFRLPPRDKCVIYPPRSYHLFRKSTKHLTAWEKFCLTDITKSVTPFKIKILKTENDKKPISVVTYRKHLLRTTMQKPEMTHYEYLMRQQEGLLVSNDGDDVEVNKKTKKREKVKKKTKGKKWSDDKTVQLNIKRFLIKKG